MDVRFQGPEVMSVLAGEAKRMEKSSQGLICVLNSQRQIPLFKHALAATTDQEGRVLQRLVRCDSAESSEHPDGDINF